MNIKTTTRVSLERYSRKVWMCIALIRSITGPSMFRQPINTKRLSAKKHIRCFPNFKRRLFGEILLEIDVPDKKSHTVLTKELEYDKCRLYRILIPKNSSLEFEGFITEIPLNIEPYLKRDSTPDKRKRYKLVLRVAGPVTIKQWRKRNG